MSHAGGTVDALVHLETMGDAPEGIAEVRQQAEGVRKAIDRLQRSAERAS